MRALALLAALLLAAAPARADDPADDDTKVPPSQYQNVSNDQLAQIIAQHKEMAQQLHLDGNGKPDREAIRAYFQAHKDVEPYLGLPTDPAQQELFNKTFGKRAFETTHDQAHFLLIGAAKQPDASGSLRDNVSKIIGGVGQIVNSGLEYAGIKEQHLPPDQEKALLEQADHHMVAAGNLLATVPTQGNFGNNAQAVLIAVEPKVEETGARGALSVISKVTSWDHVQNVIDNNPANPGLNVAAGNEALSQNDPAKAKKYYDDALSIDPGNADALAGRAGANLDLKDMNAAAQDAKDALRIDPSNAGAKAVLALAHDTTAGGVTIDKNNPFSQQAGTDGASAASRGPFGESALRYLPPSNGAGLQSSAFTREALSALNLGDKDAARRAADRAISLDPKNADAYALRAFANTRPGHYDEALKDAVAALALDPANTMAQNARAKAYNQMHMYNEALAAADDAIRANPRNAYAYYMRAMALNGLGRRKDMLSSLGQAAALDPRYQDAYDLAKAAPDEKDLGFLFPEDQLAAARAALGSQPRGPKRYFWGLTMPTIVGAALVLFGLLHFGFTWAAPRLRGSYAAAVRTGPSLSGSTVAAPLPTPPPLSTGRQPPAGTVLRGQYRRLGQIGSSVHGAVYEGMDQALERRVVIRKLRAEMRAADRERLLAPARAAASLANAGIAAVYSVFEEGESLYLVSEFASGRSLRDSLAARGPLPWEEALPLFKQAAAALDYAHAKGIAHGAVKASNLMISGEGRVKLVDFGLSRGPADKAADLTAFAACLREAIAGLPPAQLDAVDAALARARAQLGSAAQVLEVVESALVSAA